VQLLLLSGSSKLTTYFQDNITDKSVRLLRDWNGIQEAEMKYLRTAKGCTRLDQIRNEDIRNDLGISSLSEK
jgi:hypothetical protein